MNKDSVKLADRITYENLKGTFQFQPATFIFNSQHYQNAQSLEIDSFIQLKNTKPHIRLNYTLKDGSLIIGEKASFGSIEAAKEVTFEETQQFFETFLSHILKLNVREIYWKHFPEIYQHKWHAYTIQALLNLGFIIEGNSVNFHLSTQNDFRKQLSNDTLRRLQKFDKSNFEVQILNEFNTGDFFSQLEKWRNDRNIPLNVDKTVLEKLIYDLKSSYIFFKVSLKNELIAFSLGLKVSEEVLYQFIPAHNPEYDNYSPIIPITESMHNYAKKSNMKYLDLGIASEMRGEENFGLIRFKEKCGGIPGMKYNFYKKLK